LISHSAASRIPLIKFKGKRSSINLSHNSIPRILNNIRSAPTQGLAKEIDKSKPLKASNGVDFWTLAGGAWYGRPHLLQSEIDAIESGGASIFGDSGKTGKKR
jgi:hypothetical protein